MFYTYIVTNKRNGTLYTGHTDDLWGRVEAHRSKAFGGFSAKYNLTRLVWYEAFETRHEAFTRERRIKNWNRAWKLELIESANPLWKDLHECGYIPLPGQPGYEAGGYTGSRLSAGRAKIESEIEETQTRDEKVSRMQTLVDEARAGPDSPKSIADILQMARVELYR